MTLNSEDDLRACIARLYRKADIMRLDARNPVARGDAEELRALAEVALRYIDRRREQK
jgi:hypothetical protein